MIIPIYSVNILQAFGPGPIPQEAQNFNQMEKPKPSLERRIFIRNSSHRAFPPEFDIDSLGQRLWQT